MNEFWHCTGLPGGTHDPGRCGIHARPHAGSRAASPRRPASPGCTSTCWMGKRTGSSCSPRPRRFCPAVLTSPRAATTLDTVLTPECVTRSLTDVLSVESAELSELVWAWDSAVRTVHEGRQRCLNVVEVSGDLIHHACAHVEVRSCPASAQTRVGAQNRIRLVRPPGKPSWTTRVRWRTCCLRRCRCRIRRPASSARRHTIRPSLHRPDLVRSGFISPIGCRAARHLRLTLSGLFPLSMTASAVRELAGYHGQISAVQAASSSRANARSPTTTLTLSDLPRAVRGRPLVSAAVAASSHSPAKRRDGGHDGGGMPPGMAGPSGCHPAAAGLRSARPT